MTRKTLRRNIELRNNSLNLRQAEFVLINEQSKLAQQKWSPYLIVGIGLFAGIAAKVVGWRRLYSLAVAGIRLYPFIINSSVSSDESIKNG